MPDYLVGLSTGLCLALFLYFLSRLLVPSEKRREKWREEGRQSVRENNQ